MSDKRMTFLKAFPGLDLPREVRDLMEGVTVTRLAINSARNRLHVYITSENWIRKQYIYEAEDAIAEQIFTNVTMEVKIVERFVLSEQYTPKNFYKYYRTSMLLELKEVSPLLHQMFLHTSLDFDGNTIIASIPDTIISRDRKEQLIEYLDKIFAERAGFADVHVVGDLIETNTRSLFEADDERIRNKVNDVLRRNANRREKHEESQEKQQKLPNASEKKYRQQKTFISSDPNVILGRGIDEAPVPIAELGEDPHEVVVRGCVFGTESRETKNGKIILNISMTD